MIICAAAPVAAQDIKFERPKALDAASPEIIGGSKLDPDLWPATFIFTSSAGERCTATVIGPRVMLTAGHCIRGSDTGGIAGAKVTVRCDARENYSSGAPFDVALCFASAEIKLAPGVPYERLDVGRPVHRDEQLMLLGYGCTLMGGASGVLYGGGGYVCQPATEVSPVFVTSGGAAVCSGDSGGGAYRVSDAISRKIVGVASAMAGSDRSNSAALTAPDIVQFFRDWSSSRVDPTTGQRIKVDICGLDSIYTCHL